MESHSNIIVGGGITGLYSALLALDSGQKDIHVFEATDRVGGKIKSATLNGQVLNMGAEFIDSDHTRLRRLCERLGLPLEENPTMLEDQFQGPNGKIVPGFLEQYAPAAGQVRRDHEIMKRDPDGAYARALKSMPLSAYMEHLAQTVDTGAHGSFSGRLWKMVTFRGGKISPALLQTAMQAYTSEVGQPVQNISAGQFIAETSPSDDIFLSSDCKYRVHGGTEAMIRKLYQYLEAHGVTFHFNEKLDAVHKNPHGGIDLTFTGAGGTQQFHTPSAVIGLPTYALAGVKGFETFGMADGLSSLLADIQYTNSVKFTVPVRPGVRLPDQNLFTPNVQNWMPAEGYITFLCNNRDGASPAQLVQQTLANYARVMGNGKSAGDLFDTGPGKIAFANPGKVACYSTPSPKNAVVAEQTFKQLESLADQGLGIAGTYMPLHGSVGFMECGAASAERVHARMKEAEQSRAQEAVKPPLPGFQDKELARRNATAIANDNGKAPGLTL